MPAINRTKEGASGGYESQSPVPANFGADFRPQPTGLASKHTPGETAREFALIRHSATPKTPAEQERVDAADESGKRTLAEFDRELRPAHSPEATGTPSTF